MELKKETISNLKLSSRIWGYISHESVYREFVNEEGKIVARYRVVPGEITPETLPLFDNIDNK